MKITVIFIVLAVLLAGAVILDRPQAPAAYTFVNRGEVHTLDPQRMSWMQDFRIADAVFEGLVANENDHFEKIDPGVAEAWEVSPDGLTYTFHLRQTARWSNGDPVTASDFAYSWQRGMLPDTIADYADLFFKIRGAREFFDWRAAQLETYRNEVKAGQWPDLAGRAAKVAQMRKDVDAKFAELVGVKVIQSDLLVVTLAAPTPYMLDLFAFGTFFPVHPPTIEKYITLDPDTGSIRQDHSWTKPDKMVCNGPYILAVWRYKRDMRLERNPYYWNPSGVASDSLVCLSIEDTNTAVLAFETGTIDWLSDVQVDYRADMLAQAARYRERNGARFGQMQAEGMDYDDIMAALARESPPESGERNDIHALAAYGTYFYNFNCRPTLNNGGFNPFKDAAVRRAFAMALDKKAIVSSVTRMNQPVANVLIPPGSIPGFNGPPGIGYDPDEARRILAADGWEDRNGDGRIEDEGGRQFPVVEILYPSAGEHKDIAQAIAAMWERELRVETQLREEETKVAAEHLKRKNYMVARGNWFGDYGDPTTFLDLNRTGNGNNDRGYTNPEFDDLMARADVELDPAARMKLLERADAIIVNEDVPLVPLYHQVTVYMYDPARFQGLSQHPRLTQFLSELKVLRP